MDKNAVPNLENDKDIKDKGEIDNDVEMATKKKPTTRRKPTKGVRRGRVPTKKKKK